MTHVVWDSALELGVPALDAQHRQLFALRNALEDCCLGPDADHSERFHEVLAALYSYSITHFAAEEAYMESIGYPGRAHMLTNICTSSRCLPTLTSQRPSIREAPKPP